MNNKKECAAYFRENQEYRRIFAAMRKKWESLGRTAGNVTLTQATKEERCGLERLLGISMPEGRITFSLPQFEQALQETRYAGVTLPQLLEEYYGEALVSSREKKRQEKDREQEFWGTLEARLMQDRPEYEECISWLREMQEQKSGGYSTLMKEYRKSEEDARKLVWQIAECLRLCRTDGKTDKEFRGEGVRLAVLAAQTTGNPHALDRQSAAGTLLSCALCRRSGWGFPQNARLWKELYEKNGILVDALSSTIAAYGIHLETADGLHPAYEGYLQRKEPCVITLANLESVRRAYGESKHIYIVENEMVFSELLEAVSSFPVTLLCTSGQPRTAAYQLFELLAGDGVRFYYAGDMDPEGLDIAERIWRSFPEQVHIWRMSRSDYEKAMSEEPIPERRLEMLKNLTHPELRKTAEQILKHKKAGYQELLLEDMQRDIRFHENCLDRRDGN
ncbi:MAG: TIGR02679 family protein [Lachnospiraceae bacterium]|nr:TIGR02679 family protein [Lachnospiraceae bacterium]